VVDEIIQRRLVWTFVDRVWWMLMFLKLLSKKCSRRQFWGFFTKYFKNILWLFFGLFRGSKKGPPTPVRGSGNWSKIVHFRPRETLTGTSEFPFPRIYGLWQTLMFIGFNGK
jgi:hypothetical protein